MRFQQLGPNGITDVEIDGSAVLCGHRASVQLTAAPETGTTNGLALFLSGHTVADNQTTMTSIALLDVAAAAQLVVGIEAAMQTAPASMRQAFLDQITLRGGH